MDSATAGDAAPWRPLSGTLYAGALYDLVYAVLFVVAPAAAAAPLALPLPGERFYLWLIAALLAITASCYLVAARDPRRHRPLVAIAIAGRLAGFALFALATVGRPDLRGLWVVGGVDLAFALSHLITGRRLWW